MPCSPVTALQHLLRDLNYMKCHEIALGSFTKQSWRELSFGRGHEWRNGTFHKQLGALLMEAIVSRLEAIANRFAFLLSQPSRSLTRSRHVLKLTRLLSASLQAKSFGLPKRSVQPFCNPWPLGISVQHLIMPGSSNYATQHFRVTW